MAREVSPEQWEAHARHMKLAEKWAEKALAYDPGDPQLFTHKPSAFVKAYRWALDEDPDPF